jgi:hypothetical protein
VKKKPSLGQKRPPKIKHNFLNKIFAPTKKAHKTKLFLNQIFAPRPFFQLSSCIGKSKLLVSKFPNKYFFGHVLDLSPSAGMSFMYD